MRTAMGIRLPRQKLVLPGNDLDSDSLRRRAAHERQQREKQQACVLHSNHSK